MNIVMLVGNVTRDPERHTVGKDLSKVTFTLAVPMRFKRGETQFIDIVAWRGAADTIAQHVRKGDKLAVSGALEIRKYTDKQGNERRVTEVNLDQFTFCGAPKRDDATSAQPQIYAEDSRTTNKSPSRFPPPSTAYPDMMFEESPPFGDDDVPF